MCYNKNRTFVVLTFYGHAAIIIKRSFIMHLQEKTVGTQPIYDGKIIKVQKDKAELENGAVVDRELVIHPGGVCIVPVDKDGNVYLVRQFRYPFQEVLTEIPAGKLEFGENHRDAGLRELKEETGAECESFEYLGVMYPSVAYLTEKIHMYLATGLKFDKQSLDEDEFLDVEKVPLADAVKMVVNGEIKDGKTQTALLLAAKRMGKF